MTTEKADKPSDSLLLSAFLEHRDTLAAYLARRVIAVDDVDDIIQEAFAESLAASQKTKIKSPKSYLFIVARNILSKQFAKERRVLLRELDDAALSAIPSPEPFVDEQVFYRMKLHALREAVDTLPRQCRKVFLLRKFMGMSQKQIADKLDISTSTVERHITNAIARIHIALRQQGYSEDTWPLQMKRDSLPAGKVKHES